VPKHYGHKNSESSLHFFLQKEKYKYQAAKKNLSAENIFV
jgi:hypothetical protein